MKQIQIKKLLLLNFPYLIGFYIVDKGAWLFRHCTGDSWIVRMGVMLSNFKLAFSSWLPSLHLYDLLAGAIAAVILKLIVVYRGKNAKKFRQGEEYGSARWGTAKDIEPFLDPVLKTILS